MEPNVPPQQAPPQTTPNPQPASKNQLLTILSIIILILIGSSLYLGYQNMQLKKQIILLSTPKLIPTTSPTPIPQVTTISTPLPTPIFTITNDPITKQNIYTNQTYGFNFLYPSNYSVLSEQEGGISGPWTGNPQHIITLADRTTVRPGTDGPFSAFTIATASQNTSSFDAYMTNEVTTEKTSQRGIESDQITNILVNGVPAAYIESEANIRRYFIPTKNDKNVIVFSTGTRSETFLKTIDQILATFKFTN